MLTFPQVELRYSAGAPLRSVGALRDLGRCHEVPLARMELQKMPENVQVLSVVGSIQSEAKKKLTSVGLKVGTITAAASAITPEGRVNRSTPLAATLVE